MLVLAVRILTLRLRAAWDAIIKVPALLCSLSLFQKTPGRLVPDGWVGPKSSGCRCHFRAFQLKLFILDIQNFGNGPVVEELQLFEVGRIWKISGKSEDFYHIAMTTSQCWFQGPWDPDFNWNNFVQFNSPS